MVKIISNLINACASILLSVVIANYGIEEFYSFLQKEVIRKIQIGLPSLTKMTNQLTCKKFNENMELVSYSKRHCSNKGGGNGKK
jgi:hypothetical protein